MAKHDLSEQGVLQRLRLVMTGFPFKAGGRDNPENDRYFLALDAHNCIEGLIIYARHLEAALKHKMEN